MKTAELTGAALDWAVAQIEKPRLSQSRFNNVVVLAHGGAYAPSINWKQGGPIIEREYIAIDFDGQSWCASANDKPRANYGDTPLIAAMRCYVASKLGDEVDVPKELTQ